MGPRWTIRFAGRFRPRPCDTGADPRGVPAWHAVLGVCRGFQEINVALGGTLHQAVHACRALPIIASGTRIPSPSNTARPTLSHSCRAACFTTPGRRAEAQVNSVHGQGVARLAPGLIVEADAADGLIEAFRGDGPGFLAGVQWHPEWMFRENPFQLPCSGPSARPRARGGVQDDQRPSCRQPGGISHGHGPYRLPGKPAAAAVAHRATQQDPTVLEAFVVDVNGIARGKWVPAERIDEVMRKGVALPRSVYALDVWGCDVPEAGSVHRHRRSGRDLHAGGRLAASGILAGPADDQVLLRMLQQDGTPFYADPRQVLARVASIFAETNLTPVMATELEFYLIDKRRTPRDPVSPPMSHEGRWKGWQTQVLSIAELHSFEPRAGRHLRCLRAAEPAGRHRGAGERAGPVPGEPQACERPAGRGRPRLPAEAHRQGCRAPAWLGRDVHGQALRPRRRQRHARAHVDPGPLRPQHHGGGERRAERQAAPRGRRHDGHDGRLPCCCWHRMPTAIAGCPRARHAPTNITWGLDNRTAAIRVITAGQATRVEHRVAGADCNPYLAIAGILAGALHGLSAKWIPAARSTARSATGTSRCRSTGTMRSTRSTPARCIGEYLGADYQDLFSACKRQEQAEFRRRVTDVEYDAYLQSV